MKLLLILPIFRFAWTTQAHAYAGNELVHLPRTNIPTHLLARYIDRESVDLGQTLFARELPYEPKLTARGLLLPTIVRRGDRAPSPSRQRAGPDSPRASPLQRQGNTHSSLDTQSTKLPHKVATAAVGGMLSAGTMLGIGLGTNWNNQNHALGAAAAMGCIGATAATGACLYHRYNQQRAARSQQTGSRSWAETHSRQSTPLIPAREKTSSATELQPIRSYPGYSMPNIGISSDPNHPENLVRRFLMD